MFSTYDKFMIYGVIIILSFGAVLMLLRKAKARNSEQAKEALKYGTIYTTIFIVVYCVVFSILYKLIAS